MQMEDFIPADEFCTHYNIEFSFINTLREFGLVEITTVNNTEFIPANRLHELEKFVRLHYELDINPEGIEAIDHLLQRVKAMQHEITFLKNKLRLYETFE